MLDRVSTYKYLGVIIDEQYCAHEDIQRQTRCIYARGNVLIKKFSVCTNDVKPRHFKSCHTLYCSQLWCSYNSASFTKLQSNYNNIFNTLNLTGNAAFHRRV